jgi:DNA invertase Pin-like site-specific DNA recombinase
MAAAGEHLAYRHQPTHLDLTTPLGRGFIAFLSAMAEDERGRILKRANDGRIAAKTKGTRFGRKPKLTEHPGSCGSDMRCWRRIAARCKAPGATEKTAEAPACCA